MCLAQEPQPHVPILHSKPQRPQTSLCYLWGGCLKSQHHKHRHIGPLPLSDMEWAPLAGESTDSVFSPHPQEPHAPQPASNSRGWLEHEKPFSLPTEFYIDTLAPERRGDRKRCAFLSNQLGRECGKQTCGGRGGGFHHVFCIDFSQDG